MEATTVWSASSTVRAHRVRAVCQLDEATIVSVFVVSFARASSGRSLSTRGSYYSSFLRHHLCSRYECVQSVNSWELQQFLFSSSIVPAHQLRSVCHFVEATTVSVCVVSCARTSSACTLSIRESYKAQYGGLCRQLCGRIKFATSSVQLKEFTTVSACVVSFARESSARSLPTRWSYNSSCVRLQLCSRYKCLQSVN